MRENMEQIRKYPVGIQDLEKLRTKGAFYVDINLT